MGPTLVAYLRGAGVGVAGIVEATTKAVAAGMVGALWLATEAAATAVGASAAAAVGGGTAAAVTAVSGMGLDPLVGGGEEWALGA